MSSYPTEPWQDSGKGYCKDVNPFPPRANEGVVQFQAELGYVNNGMQNGGGADRAFGPNRWGRWWVANCMQAKWRLPWGKMHACNAKSI